MTTSPWANLARPPPPNEEEPKDEAPSRRSPIARYAPPSNVGVVAASMVVGASAIGLLFMFVYSFKGPSKRAPEEPTPVVLVAPPVEPAPSPAASASTRPKVPRRSPKTPLSPSGRDSLPPSPSSSAVSKSIDTPPPAPSVSARRRIFGTNDE